MSEMSPDAAERHSGRQQHSGHRAARGANRSTGGGLRTTYLLAAVLPATVMALVGAGVAAYLATAHPSTTGASVVLAVGATLGALVLIGAAGWAEIASRRVQRRLASLRSLVVRGQAELQNLVDRIRGGERFAPYEPGSLPRPDEDPFNGLAAELEKAHVIAGNAVISLSGSPSAAVAPAEVGQRLEVFVNIARRMQSMVHREISVLDELEAQVEDPDLLKGLFHVDHLATRMRRQSESLAVLGGAAPRRQWSTPVSLYEVVRAAVAEVEHYSRVKVVPPVDGTLVGAAVADTIHLLAELIENATKFSPSDVTVRAAVVAAGLAIEVDDRGLGMQQAEQLQMNALLHDPSQINIGELLRDGRIGLFVVSALARRHGIRVQLQSNIYGGTQAVVILPQSLIDSQGDGEEPEPQAAAVPQAPPGQRPALPVRDITPAVPLSAPPPPAPAAPAPPQAAVPPPPPATAGDRPPLPTRPVQQSLAPELRDGPQRPRDEGAYSEHSPGLMAAFQTGFDRSERDEDDLEDGAP